MSHPRPRLHESVPVHPLLRRLPLPWPMTLREVGRWLAVCLLVCVVPAALAAWVTAAVTEPSIWRLLVPLTWLIVFKAAVLPLLARGLNPGDVDTRWHRWGAQESQTGQAC